MRGLSEWFGAANGVWSMWTVSLLRTALGHVQAATADFRAAASGWLTTFSGDNQTTALDPLPTSCRSFQSLKSSRIISFG